MKIDARGKQCPAPIIMTKKGINSAKEGEQIVVLLDNDTSCSNLSNFLNELKIEYTLNYQNEYTSIVFFKGNNSKIAILGEEVCEVPNIKSSISNYAVVLKTETMGEGDAELGKLLMRAYLSTICDGDLPLPKSVVMYNAGVKLAIQNSDTSLKLKELESRGVEIVACGTCVDFYELKGQISVGTIGNMYKINEILMQVSKVIYP